MELIEAIKKRISLRRFNGEMPSQEDINGVLEALYHAPALFTTKDAHVSVITDKALLAELDACGVAKFKRYMPNMPSAMYGAPVLILLSAKLFTESPKGWEGTQPEDFNRNIYWAMGSIIQTMQLRAVDLGLASCPINTVVVSLHDNPELARKAGVPEGYTTTCALVIGKSDYQYKEREGYRDHYQVTRI